LTRAPVKTPGQSGFDGNLAKWFDNQARSNPDAIAIIDDRARTYDELRRRMMAYTRGLSSYDLQTEATVALLVSRDFDMVALMLAILWCGHAYVPIDPDDPVDRGIGILNAASCALVVADARQLKEQGEEVELLFLLDPMSPVQYRSSESEEVVRSHSYQRLPFSERLVRELRHLVRHPVAGFQDTSSKAMREFRKLRVWQRLTYHRLDLYGRYPSRFTSFMVPKNRWPAFWMTARQLARSYVAEPYDDVCLAVFHEQGPRYDIWRSILSGNAEFTIVETYHMGFFEEPAVGHWMELLSSVVRVPRDLTATGAVPSVPVTDS